MLFCFLIGTERHELASESAGDERKSQNKRRNESLYINSGTNDTGPEHRPPSLRLRAQQVAPSVMGFWGVGEKYAIVLRKCE